MGFHMFGVAVVSWLLVLIFECDDGMRYVEIGVVSWLLVLIFECDEGWIAVGHNCCVLASSADL